MSYRYLGNKTKLTNWIVDTISQSIPPNATVADPMCGTAAVSNALDTAAVPHIGSATVALGGMDCEIVSTIQFVNFVLLPKYLYDTSISQTDTFLKSQQTISNNNSFIKSSETYILIL